jgi:hypothetical protein
MRVTVLLSGGACSTRMCRDWSLHDPILMRLTGEMAFGCLSIKRGKHTNEMIGWDAKGCKVWDAL